MRNVTIKGLLAHKLRLALTSLAIVLGVTFISGSFVLTDTLHSLFFALVGNIYQKIDFEVRGVAQFPGKRALTPCATLCPSRSWPTVRRVPGVEAAYGEVAGYAQFLSRTGQPIATGARADPRPQTSTPTIGSPSCASSRASRRRARRSVAMDAGTAKKYHFSVGQSVRVLFGGADADVHDHRDRAVRDG